MTVTIPNNLGHIYKVKATLRAKVILAVSTSVFRQEVYVCSMDQIKFVFEVVFFSAVKFLMIIN